MRPRPNTNASAAAMRPAPVSQKVAIAARQAAPLASASSSRFGATNRLCHCRTGGSEA